MSKFNETDEFKRLNKEWSKKLKKSGFKDAEDSFGNLNKWSGQALLERTERDGVSVTARVEYFRLATHFLLEHKFESRLDKRAWELHADGVSIRDIVKRLKRYYPGLYRDKVHILITKLKTIMVDKYKASIEQEENDRTED